MVEVRALRFVLLLILAVLFSCSPPIWNKLQKRAAVAPSFKGILNEAEPSTLVNCDFSNWQRYWIPESEQSCTIQYLPDSSLLDIKTTKGLTLWYKDPFEGDLTFRYQIRAVSGTDSLDRCSDLNCFWMATDPLHPESIFVRKDFRGGVFGKSYSLVLYYMGFGGNSNSTTRFRKYDGDLNAFMQGKQRPSVLKEYTDVDHLIKADHWYSVVISVHKGLIEYSMDNEFLVQYRDEMPLLKGWFGFRSTKNHFQVRNFSVTKH